MTKIEKEFNDLVANASANNIDKSIDDFCRQYEGNEDAKLEIDRLLKKSVATAGKRIDDLSIKMQLQETAEMLNLSFIAKHYFHKTRGWLSQRINSHVVNGKPAKFTEKEMDTLNFALKDMGKKIGSISVHC